MKIAVLSSSFYESTFPLVKHLASYAEIELFCMVQKSFLNPAMLDLSHHEQSLQCGVYDQTMAYSLIPDHVKSYFDIPNVSISIVAFSGGSSILKDIGTCLKLTKKLKRSKFDRVHFIGTYVLNFLVEGRLDRHKVVHSLHESIDRLLSLESSWLKKIMLKIQFRIIDRKGLRLIFHSENVRNNYLDSFKKDRTETTVIPFGLFEGYKSFIEDTDLEIPFTDYFLFVGYIHPYKGVDLLISVAQSVMEKQIDIPFVIAGKDATEIEKRYNLPANIHFINKFLSESELITLIKRSYAIVLPYTSASQSGIPNTCFCFNKPVIASDLDGIKDIIHT